MTTTDQHINGTMRIVESPASNDVLCGKDKTFNRNIGNMIYRQLIISTATRYARIKTKPEKMKITAHIVHTMIQQHKSRFLKQVMTTDVDNDDDNGSDYHWQEISITAARDKTSHALRFCASQMRLQTHHEPYATPETSSMVPVTPTMERRSIRGRVQRKSIRYSPSTIETTTLVTTTEKHNPVRHRRTVSSENAAQLNPSTAMTLSMDPNEYYNQQNYYHANQQYYYQYHERNHYVQCKDENPVPMECSSVSVPTYVDSHSNNESKRPYNTIYHNHPHYRTASPNFVKYHHRSLPPTGVQNAVGSKYDEDEEDDLDAILREPIQWDDENNEENDDEEEIKAGGEAFEL